MLKRIRIYSPFFPMPAVEGALQVIADQANALCSLGFEVEIVSWKGGGVPAASPSTDRGPTPLDSRIRITRLTGRDHSNRATRVAASLLSEASSPELYYYPPSARPTLPEADLGIYHYSFCYPWLAARGPASERRTAVMFHNLESELFEQRARSEPKVLHRAIHRRNAQKLARHEAKLAELADEIWFVSGEDQEHYQPSVGAHALYRVLGPGFPTSLRERRNALFFSRAQSEDNPLILGFIGALDFLPNLDSALWLVRELAPALKGRGYRGEIRIAGKSPPPSLLESARRFPFVKVLGFVENAESFWKDLSFSAVPHVSGSGVRMKLLESLASGVPVMATQAAVRRIHPELRASEGLWVSDSAAEWAEYLCSQRSSCNRESFARTEIPPALDSARSYSFLC